MIPSFGYSLGWMGIGRFLILLHGAFPSLGWVRTALKVTELGGATPPCPGKPLAEVKVLHKSVTRALHSDGSTPARVPKFVGSPSRKVLVVAIVPHKSSSRVPVKVVK